MLLQIPAVTRMIRTYRPRAMISAGNQSNLCLAIAAKLSGIKSTKIIQKITNPIYRPGMSGWTHKLRSWRFGLTAMLGHRTITLSKSTNTRYQKAYPKLADRFVMAHLACITDDMVVYGDQRKPKENDEPPNFLAVGRLAIQKNYPMMLQALALLKDRPWKLLVLGDGPKKHELKALAAQLGIAERIEFAGFVQNVIPAYCSSDILLLSSKWEGFPAVPVEAMATGCQVVATDCSDGLTDIIAMTGHNTVPTDDPEAFSAAIVKMLDRPADPALLRDISSKYQLNSAIDDHLAVIEHIEVEN